METNNSEDTRIPEHYSDDFPQIIYIENGGVRVNKNVPPLPGDESSFQWQRDMVESERLRAEGGGDWELAVSSIPVRLFSNRQSFDDSLTWGIKARTFDYKKHFDSLPIQVALEKVGVDSITANMEHFSKRPDDMERLLGREVEQAEVGSQKLEQQLFYAVMSEFFGKDFDDSLWTAQEKADFRLVIDKALKVKDFHLLSRDGNFAIASAQRGEHYIMFRFTTG